jgi:hypothetical protein
MLESLGLGMGITGLTLILGCGITAVTIGFIVVTFVIVGQMKKRVMRGDADLAQNGVPAKATILRIWDTGVRWGGREDVQMGFDLQVTPPAGDPYQAQAKAIIPMIHISQFQPGREVPIKIHPTDPSKIILDIYA